MGQTKSIYVEIEWLEQDARDTKKGAVGWSKPYPAVGVEEAQQVSRITSIIDTTPRTAKRISDDN